MTFVRGGIVSYVCFVDHKGICTPDPALRRMLEFGPSAHPAETSSIDKPLNLNEKALIVLRGGHRKIDDAVVATPHRTARPNPLPADNAAPQQEQPDDELSFKPRDEVHSLKSNPSKLTI
jgi:hypothetical protein